MAHGINNPVHNMVCTETFHVLVRKEDDGQFIPKSFAKGDKVDLQGFFGFYSDNPTKCNYWHRLIQQQIDNVEPENVCYQLDESYYGDYLYVNKVIVDKAFLDAAPKLKLICEAGTGINNIDVDLCRQRGVLVRTVAAYSTDSVAQIAWMHILNLAGRAFHYNDFVHSGAYSQNVVHVDYRHPFTELTGKTLGIVGMG